MAKAMASRIRLLSFTDCSARVFSFSSTLAVIFSSCSTVFCVSSFCSILSSSDFLVCSAANALRFNACSSRLLLLMSAIRSVRASTLSERVLLIPCKACWFWVVSLSRDSRSSFLISPSILPCSRRFSRAMEAFSSLLMRNSSRDPLSRRAREACSRERVVSSWAIAVSTPLIRSARDEPSVFFRRRRIVVSTKNAIKRIAMTIIRINSISRVLGKAMKLTQIVVIQNTSAPMTFIPDHPYPPHDAQIINKVPVIQGILATSRPARNGW
ncbi:MAG: hypothetical protein BWX87_02618 [Bacteroidetes bacterium ADurb.Bin123]|nr:MAG: hypothetical protein BWX87_02618 [Bacteroidetes bacterium ADurb.Bin123]